ncbi:hypothetical protein [Butyricimonas sp. Marseille-P3923]|uniref:golvesin C-terminal-like domain-containing protein n=1 Tax=Butyricimonas sp. Marseille-P3923 TaxID=1987504 RepID=UPI000C07AA18|nr:hypothetical protein [Butyricimonas sp. Marseille-P3923]
MNFQNIRIITSHTFKILMRNRLLQFLFLFIWICIVYVQVLNQSMDTYNARYLDSFYPYMNAFLFTLFQTLPLVVVASVFLNRKQRIDTIETTYYHSESNAEYVWSSFLGFLSFFGLAAVISLLLGVLVRTSSSHFFFSLLLNCFYLLTLVVPSAVFMIGFSFFISSWVKNQLLCKSILLGYVCLTFYVGDVYKGIFDFWGVTLPGAFSDFVGHPDPGRYLLQRAGWLCLGLAFVQLAVFRFERIPNNPKRFRARNIACVFFILGVIFMLSFLRANYIDHVSRQKYIETYGRYAASLKGTLVSQIIRYAQQGGKMSVNSEFLVRNQSDSDIPELLLYLNPGLHVTSLTSGNEVLSFERENQVVRVKHSLLQGDSLRVYMTYEGQIDENVCYPDISFHEITETGKKAHLACRYGKRYAFLEKDFTLLIPEVLWYPVTVPSVNPHSRFEVSKNFSRYTLRVENPGEKTVISQGERSGVGKDIIFKNEIPLPGISLCMGNYMTKRVEIDSTVYELNILQSHKSLLYSLWNRKKVSPFDMISWVRNKAELTMGKSYPYLRFMLVETPISFTSYFRNERGGSGFVQPELLFFPENGIGRNGSLESMFDMKGFFNSLFFKEEDYVALFSWNQLFGLDRLRGGLRELPMEDVSNNYYIGSLFYNQLGSIISSDYACMDAVINLILQDNSPTRKDGWKKFNSKVEEEAIYYLKEHSLKDAFEDESLRFEALNVLMALKGRELIGLLDARGAVVDSVVAFLVGFQDKYKFKEVDFNVLEHEFKERFGVSWNSLLKPWYEKKGVPRYYIRSWESLRVETSDGDKWRRKFAIFNDSDVDGVVYVKTLRSVIGNAAFFGPVDDRSGAKDKITYKSYEVKANSGIEVVAHEEDNINLKILLLVNIASNLPREVSLGVYNVYCADTLQYVYAIGKDYFMPDSNEIIVDNEDAGFKIVQSASRVRLGDYLHEKSLKPWEKYANFEGFFGINVTDKWKSFFTYNGYGDVVKSYLFKRAGGGKSCLEWSVRLHKEGKYEIFVYITPDVIRDLSEPQNQYYTLVNEENEYSLQLINMRRNGGWYSLGVFHLESGISKVILSDKGIKEQTIVGDAVKWVFKGEK